MNISITTLPPPTSLLSSFIYDLQMPDYTVFFERIPASSSVDATEKRLVLVNITGNVIVYTRFECHILGPICLDNTVWSVLVEPVPGPGVIFEERGLDEISINIGSSRAPSEGTLPSPPISLQSSRVNSPAASPARVPHE